VRTSTSRVFNWFRYATWYNAITDRETPKHPERRAEHTLKRVKIHAHCRPYVLKHNKTARNTSFFWKRKIQRDSPFSFIRRARGSFIVANDFADYWKRAICSCCGTSHVLLWHCIVPLSRHLWVTNRTVRNRYRDSNPIVSPNTVGDTIYRSDRFPAIPHIVHKAYRFARSESFSFSLALSLPQSVKSEFHWRYSLWSSSNGGVVKLRGRRGMEEVRSSPRSSIRPWVYNTPP